MKKSDSKIAFIISVHPPHYHYVYNYLDQLTDECDLFLVFSDEFDYGGFERKEKINKIIMPKNTIDGHEGVINYKKFYALEQLKDSKYDYFIVCDSEIELTANYNYETLYNKVFDIFNKKIIFGSDFPEYDWIMKDSAGIFPIKYQDEIKNITKNYTIYTFWGDLPVYKREHIDHFFSLINYSKIRYAQFDHIIYGYYLCLFHNFTIKSISDETGIIIDIAAFNTTNIDILNKLKEIGYRFNWTMKKQYIDNKDFYDKYKTIIVYNIDRSGFY